MITEPMSDVQPDFPAVIGKGLEPIFEQSMRDRNRLALQSDLLGAAGN
jgi:hypothetical protein